jgi:hypothetical protein
MLVIFHNGLGVGSSSLRVTIIAGSLCSATLIDGSIDLGVVCTVDDVSACEIQRIVLIAAQNVLMTLFSLGLLVGRGQEGFEPQ